MREVLNSPWVGYAVVAYVVGLLLLLFGGLWYYALPSRWKRKH